MYLRPLVNGSVLARHKRIIMFVALVVPFFATTITAQTLNSTLLRNTGAISYPQTLVRYLMINATATYELSSTFQVVYQNTNSLTVFNHALSDVSAVKGSLFVYNGTYQVSGTINMRSNVNMTLQDGVFINETGANVRIFSFSSISNSSIFAKNNATIHGLGAHGYDMEVAFYLQNCYNITLSAEGINGLAIYNIGAQWFLATNINSSLLQNLYGYNWALMGLYAQHGMILEGYNNQLINVTSDAGGGNARCPLVIQGERMPSVNNTIIGGLYENSPHDNGIYVGGWMYPVLGTKIINVTTAHNAAPGHSGIKLRPATNTTVVGWVSNGDYNGMESGTEYNLTVGGETNTQGSSYNDVSGTINSPLNCGLILYVDGSDRGQSVQYNTYHLIINNASQPGVWINNDWANTNSSISYNVLYINVTGGQKAAIEFSGLGNSSYNTIYGTFIQNGKSGYSDIIFDNVASINHNTINVYSTSGNPRGLYSGGLGTNVVVYPYST